MPTQRYFACKVSQRATQGAVAFAVFVAPTKQIVQWAGVRRVGEHAEGTQRILKATRVKSIEKYFTRDPQNTIPTSVLLAFGEGSTAFESFRSAIEDCVPGIDLENSTVDRLDWGVLSFDYTEGAPEDQRPALIVDGQHRLAGMAELEEDLPVLVAALLDAPPEEQAFQFIVINNKAAKVATDNVKAIVANLNEEELNERLARASINYGGITATLRDINSEEASPFRGVLNWALNPPENRKVDLTTVEASLRYIRQQLSVLEEDEDTVEQILIAIWAGIRDKYSDLWLINDKFMSKVSMTALNEFVVDRLAYAYEGDLLDIFDPVQINAQTGSIVDPVPGEFWMSGWTYRLQDTAVVRSAIKDALRAIAQNRRTRAPWNKNVKLLAEGTPSEGSEAPPLS